MIGIGAILKFALTKQVNGINVQPVGVVLMIVSAVGQLITLVLLSVRRRTEVIHRGRDVTYIEPNDPAGPALLTLGYRHRQTEAFQDPDRDNG